ncbi:hypothetical protein DPMN_132785 [Dreissena polymorpha]|uniref:Uncharacterized protein n=1 Tax=Dreissena polymorpha TaxID=45954 RepID=A0A9D4JDE5_DREPO|nr:hypothetical protein DPMN_132785 [Dreissena polymorpha]
MPRSATEAVLPRQELGITQAIISSKTDSFDFQKSTESCHGFLELLQKLKLSARNGFKQPLIITVAEKQGRTRNMMKRRNLL